MSIICSNCKTENKPTSSYCVNCGWLLSGEKEKKVINKGEFDKLLEQREELNQLLSKLSCRLVLREAGAAKLAIVKVVKETFNFGLKETKDLVDGAPSVLIEGVSKTEACHYKEIIEKAGGVVDILESIVPTGYRLIQDDEQGGKYYLELVSIGKAKLQVVKAVKESLNFGLKEAKDYVDAAPSVLETELNKDKAEKIKTIIESTGATVEVKQMSDLPKEPAIPISDWEDDFRWSDDGNENDIWYRKMMDAMKGTTNSSKIELSREEYERLKNRADMTLWGKLKESLGF